MHRTRAQRPPEFEEQPDILAYIRWVRKKFLEQEAIANCEHIQLEPHARDRYWEEYFILRMDNPRIGREAEDDHYHIPPALISRVQQGTIFQGLETEDPAAHIISFLNLCDTSKPAGLT